MEKFKKILFGFIGLYIFVALSLAHAQATPGPDESSAKWHPGQRIQEIFNQLNLTDDQKKQLEMNKQQHRAKMESSRQAMKTSREAFQQELMKPLLDRPRINEIHQQIKALQSQMEDDKLNSILAVRTILTPEQFQKFVNLMHRHKQEHDE
jgi:Spy/CpxP family protein refolding chaperone